MSEKATCSLTGERMVGVEVEDGAAVRRDLNGDSCNYMYFLSFYLFSDF